MKLDLSVKKRAKQHADHDHKPGSHCCRTNMVICPGYGDEDFKFPSAEQVVIGALARADEKFKTPEDGGKKPAPAVTLTAKTRKKGIRAGFIPGLPTKGKVPSPQADQLIPQLPTRGNVDATLFAAAEGIRLMMDAGKYDAIVAERFDDHVDKVTWAKDNLGKRKPKYMPAIISLEKQLEKLRELYLDALPRVHTVLVAQNPEESENKLLEVAIASLDEQLQQILGVLRIWTDAFGQLRSGKYKQLEAVVNAIEQAFHLFEGNQPNTGNLKERLKTIKFHLGNVFLARFSAEGPATLPGTRGPVGAHAIEVPHDERSIITLMLVLYMHEFRHDIFADVDGLGDELTAVVAKAIAVACETGAVKFVEDKVRIERSSVPMAAVMVKLFADTIGEVDADICGGVLLSGPAYLYNVISTFSAFNSKPDGVFKQDRLLRTGSYFGYRKLENGQKALEFWPHPPDYIRAYIVAAALDEIGFPAEAEQCRALADQAVGELPEHITWRNEDPKSKTVISIPVADIKAVAPVVAKALIRTQLESLGGLTTFDLVNWNENRQKKVDQLVAILMAGGSEVPVELGDVYSPYVAAAATLAYWGLVKSGMPALKAAAAVESNALVMLDTVHTRFEAAEQAAQAAGQAQPVDAAVVPADHGHDHGTAGGGDQSTAKPVRKRRKDRSAGAGEPAPKQTPGCRGGTCTK